MQRAVSFFEFVHSAAALMLQRNRAAHTRAARGAAAGSHRNDRIHRSEIEIDSHFPIFEKSFDLKGVEREKTNKKSVETHNCEQKAMSQRHAHTRPPLNVPRTKVQRIAACKAKALALVC